MDMLFISDVVLEQVNNSIALDTPQPIATVVAQFSSSIGRMPPGFNKLLELVCAATFIPAYNIPIDKMNLPSIIEAAPQKISI